MLLKIQYILLLCCTVLVGYAADDASWPAVRHETKPGTRWWWLGSAVDKPNLTYNLEKYAEAGLGAVEITPIYGVQGNDAANVPFLSPEWMELLKHTINEGNRLGVKTDMSTGTGWPFGGPTVSVRDAASRLLVRRWTLTGGDVFSQIVRPQERNQQEALLLRLMAFSNQRVINLTSRVDAEGKITWKVPAGEWELIAAFNGKTFQKVKRAAPGGEGFVIDHFSKRALTNYLSHFDKAFEQSNTPYPHRFFNDSYEAYGADWTEDFFEQFKKRRGYKLENQLPAFLASERNEQTARLVADYRETMAELLLENFTQVWTSWAHSKGSKTRNQAHGSPGNLIDLYAAVDIPECEGFGLTDFQIPGLRKDSLTRRNDSDLSMLKYASSAAHIAGKPLVSSETFTWLTEHFRTSLSQCKPDLDLMFVSGVNHMLFHGTPYSPTEAPWPGWMFYATIHMAPTNTIWKDAPAMFSYITRSQSFLQYGTPDADFLMYLPVYDVWHQHPGRFLMFDIHSMQRRMPDFIEAVHTVYENGYDVSYISDRFILSTRFSAGKLVTEGGASYHALILPAVNIIPLRVMQHILSLAKQGATIVFLDKAPHDVPGLHRLERNRRTMQRILRNVKLPATFTEAAITPYGKGKIITGGNNLKTLQKAGVKPESMITQHHLHLIRRNHAQGHHYFISSLQERNIDGWVSLAVQARSALFFDPMTGRVGKAQTRQRNGATEVYMQLQPGESIILKTFQQKDVAYAPYPYLFHPKKEQIVFTPWQLEFKDSEPAITQRFELNHLQSWTLLDNELLTRNAGTGIYTTTFRFNKKAQQSYVLKLGDVRESAQVFINNRKVQTLWAVPFQCIVDDFLVDGENTLRIEVTNLPANRIAHYDREKVKWRIFHDINMVDIRYRPSDYSGWEPMESGLLGPVEIWSYAIKTPTL